MNIWCVCTVGNLGYAKRYVDEGHDIEARDIYGQTPLSLASENGHRNIVELLVENGANIEARDDDGWTAIMRASCSGKKDIVEFLAKNNANVEIRDNDGWTTIMVASLYGHRDIVEILVRKGADVRTRWKNGCTPFSLSLTNGHLSVGRYLAPLTIPNESVPYSGVPISSFVPRYWTVTTVEYTEFVRSLVPIYATRAVGDPSFGLAMQYDIGKIIDRKIERNREPLAEKDTRILKKLLKTLRSIDYTDHVDIPSETSGNRRSNISTSSDADGRMEPDTSESHASYDMEL